MPPRPSYRSTGMQRASRRRHRYEWLAAAASQVMTPGATTQTVLLNQTDLTDLTEPTLKRLRGSLLVSLAALAPGTFFALGVTAVQLDEVGNPPAMSAWDQDNASWLWYHLGYLEDFGGGQRYYRMEVDSKAQRKLEGDYGLVLFGQNFSGTATIDVRFMGRFLVEQV